MVKNKDNIIFLLDFDGVLFDTSLEAYYVMSETSKEGSINKNTIAKPPILAIGSLWNA